MPNTKQEIVMETTHGRKDKCKTEFKAVINKVLVSGLILATLMTSTITPALAASDYPVSLGNDSKITMSYGISVEQSMSEIRNTIAAINEMKANGSVTDAMLQKLESQIYALSQAVNYSSDVDINKVDSILNDAEKSVSGLSNNGDVNVAISVTRAILGLNDSHTISPYKAQNIGNLVGFNDIDPQRHSWAIDAINDMSVGTYKGLFQGTSATDANGYAQFSPDSPMTRAQFITVVTRALYSDQLSQMQSKGGADWYDINYDVAINNKLITESEYVYSEEVLNAPIPRQEMALIIMRACGQMGEMTNATVDKSRIADYNTIGEKYQYAVRVVFSKGIIAGVDSNGTFAPNQTLTRAQGATVLYRLVNESKRQDSTPYGETIMPVRPDGTQAEKPAENVSGPITIYEGQYRTNRNAKEGDTFVKADGTQIILKKGPNGILGEGQGVAPDVGLNLGLYTVQGDGGNFSYNAEKHGNMVDSTGQSIQNQRYSVHTITGEGHWGHEWTAIGKAYPKPTYEGTYNGETSKDAYQLWVWMDGMWIKNLG